MIKNNKNHLTLLRKSDSKKKKPSRKPVKARRKSLRLKLLPRKGLICLCIKAKTGQFEQEWHETRSSAIKSIKQHDRNGNQVFISQASFKGGEYRTQENALYLRNFFADIDCGVDKNGKKKPYPTQKYGEQALRRFCELTKLPMPVIVNSGTGLYAHWLLDSDIPVTEWLVVAKKLKILVEHYEPGLDNDHLMTDAARVLRPIGSTHRKDQKDPKPVVVLRKCHPLEFLAFKQMVEAACDAIPKAPVSTGADTAPLPQDTLSQKGSATMVADNCAVIAHIKDTKGNVPEPLWYAAIGLLRHCVESPAIIHDWSSGYPGYDARETDNKIEQHAKPPTTCEHFETFGLGLCQKCTHRGKIKSPIALGGQLMTTIPEYVLKMNRDHFVSRYGSKTVVCRETIDDTLKRRVLVMTSFNHFKNFYSNCNVQMSTEKSNTLSIPLGDAWLKHEHRRQYDDIRMMPEGDKSGVYNLWRGYSVTSCEGSWGLMKKHIRNVICSGDKKMNRYVLRWLARMIQEPWRPGEVALILKGNKGVGKGKFVEPFCRLLGQHAMQIFHGKHLTGTFNAHLEDCILLYVDEAYWAGDKAAEGVLKGAITESTLPIERKGLDLKTVRNMLHIIMASNNDWVVPASMDERRYCVLHVSDKHIQDHEYFAAIDNEMKHGGLEAMLHYLQTLDISNFNVRSVPTTDELIRQKLQSLDPFQEWWFQKLREGELLPRHGWGLVPTKDLFDDFIESSQKVGRNIKSYTNTTFGMNLTGVLPIKKLKKKYRQSDNGAGRANHYDFPSLQLCRKFFEEKLGAASLRWGSPDII